MGKRCTLKISDIEAGDTGNPLQIKGNIFQAVKKAELLLTVPKRTGMKEKGLRVVSLPWVTMGKGRKVQGH